MAEIIPFPDAPAWSLRVQLSGRSYQLSCGWNSRAALWSLDIATDRGDPIVQAIHLVPSYPLLSPHADRRLPEGELVILDQTGGQLDHVGREDFAANRALLVYVPEG